MSDMKKIMDDLHSALARELLTRVESGEATASDLSVVRQFLKDNGVDSIPKDGNPLDRLSNAANLPFTEIDPEETAGHLPH
ncbi:hypothetical protein [Brucella sp. 10RB9213]|uniref:hypothetical protein n=1 Tax=Brucella sp. 10RB9213 TaxID=1844039 RepID=UPI0012ADEDE8|nr:hypothetical protein [Brucella sp. 10RB9213]MRN66412.1 hypothetical protein [Brucella sp. 10RB9213]